MTVTVEVAAPSASTVPGLAETVETVAETAAAETAMPDVVPLSGPSVALTVLVPAVFRVAENVCVPASPAMKV